MSSPTDLVPYFIPLIATVIFGFIYHKRRHRIRRLLLGQARWREIAFKHAADAKRYLRETNSWQRLCEQKNEELEVWEERFNRLVVFIWNAPIDRTLQDVLDVITEARNELNRLRETADGLSQIVRRQDATIKDLTAEGMRLRESSAQDSGRAEALTNMLAVCLKNKWVIVQIEDNLFGVRSFQKGTRGYFAKGETPEAAFEMASLRAKL